MITLSGGTGRVSKCVHIGAMSFKRPARLRGAPTIACALGPTEHLLFVVILYVD